jgi:hypothetical protein
MPTSVRLLLRRATALLISAVCIASPVRWAHHDQRSPVSTPTADNSLTAADARDAIVRNSQKLWAQGSLPDARTFDAWLKQPSGETLNLLSPSSEELGPRAIAKRAAASHLRIGWVFQCSKCSNWHANLGGAYALTKSAVATAYHVLQKPDRMKPDSGYAIAVRGDQEILVISGVLAADAVSDAAIVGLRAEDLEPIALSETAEVGDAAYCLSEPSGGRPYFSAGMVNRFTKDPDAKSADPRWQRMNVSTDWAPGSSGSAVLDVFGNAIGHVGSITSINGDRKGNEAAPHYMAVHWATPAVHVLRLADPARFTIVPTPTASPAIQKGNATRGETDSNPP